MLWIAQNRKARHDFEILDTYEAGMVLTGTEVKSLRAGRANLTDGYATVDDGEVWLRASTSPSTTRGRGPTTSRGARASCCCTAPRSAS